MSATTTPSSTILTCEGAHCREALVVHSRDRRTARLTAAGVGWATTLHGGDHCPRCAPLLAAPERVTLTPEDHAAHAAPRHRAAVR